jgi:hypothetical protein
MLVIGIARRKIDGTHGPLWGARAMDRITERRAHIQERTSKNELELALDRMISSWFRWYWLALASLLLLGFGTDIWSISEQP